MIKIKQSLLYGLVTASLAFSNFVNANVSNLTDIEAVKIRSASIPFIENVGQIDSQVAYYAKTFAGTVFVTKAGELVYSLPIDAKNKNQAWVLKEKLLNTKEVTVSSSNHVGSKLNFYHGKKENWQTNVHSAGSVTLSNAYPGIDVKINATVSNIEKFFFLKPEANVENIKLQIDGGNALSINQAQQLVVSTAEGEFTFTAPVAYQEVEGTKVPVKVAYVTDKNQYGFKLGKYDASKPLVIDPLIASTFLGGDNTNAISDFEFVREIIAKDGFVYAVGITDSGNFPTTTGFTTFGGGVYDGFIAKFDENLSTLVAGTFIGGGSHDQITGIAMDTNGDIYVSGTSGGAGFPFVSGGYQYNPDFAAGTFIAKFSNDLSSLMATSFVAGNTTAGKVALGNNSVYLIGRTNSPNIPITPGVLDTTCGSDGACDPSGSFSITKYFGYLIRQDLNLSSILAASYLGKSSDRAIKVSSNSNVYMIWGGTSIVAVNADITGVAFEHNYGSHVGFSDIDLNDDFLATVGSTSRDDLPVSPNAFDATCGASVPCLITNSVYTTVGDNFIAKLSLDLQSTLALSYFGGTESDLLTNIEIDDAGNIAIGGSTQSTDIPTSSNAFDRSLNSNRDGYVAMLNGDLSSLIYGSYIGGGSDTNGVELATGSNGVVYMSGYTGAPDFPVTADAFDTSYNGGDNDAFVSAFDTSGNTGGGGGENQAPSADAGSNQSVSPRIRVYLDGSGSSDADGDIVSYAWTQLSGKSVRLRNANSAVANFRAPRVKRGQTRLLTFELTVTDDDGATATSQVSVSVTR